MKLTVGFAESTYSTLNGALAACQNAVEVTEIVLAPGRYEENIVVTRNNLTICGTGDPQETLLVGSWYAKERFADGTRKGTFQTATLRTDGQSITLKNLTIANNAGPGAIVGQAVALYADGDQLLVENCRLLGHQDTLFTAPLPPTNGQGKNEGFGPKQDFPRTPSRQIYRNCYIEGDVDFIFGGGMALFQNCVLYSKCRPQNQTDAGHIQGYITAPSTPQAQEYGYLFSECQFLSDCPPDSVYLSRPWRDYAKLAIFNCTLGAHIKKSGYYDWQRVSAQQTVTYLEGGNNGAGSDFSLRVSWSHQLANAAIEKYKKDFYQKLTN